MRSIDSECVQQKMVQSRIRRLDARTATYGDFAEIMMANEPVILHNFSGLLPLFAAWQSEGRADVDFLRREFGDMMVPVVECSSDGYGEQRRSTMSLNEYLDTITEGRPASVAAAEETPLHDGEPSDDERQAGSLLYLKDWHFQRLRRDEDTADAAAQGTPFFFADDWLNWWCDDQRKDDYRFVYIGPPGSWTPLHHDVLNSFSWSFNVCGRKHWTLFPLEVTPYLYDRYGRELATDVRKGRADAAKFPRLEEAQRLEIDQQAGEAIFVPSGWHHQVVNTGDGITISVNTNWFNGFNLTKVHSFLLTELHAVREALEHLRESMSGNAGGGSDPAACGEDGDSAEGSREWERQCEVIMRANSALNMTEFAQMVVARARFLLLLDADHEDYNIPSSSTSSENAAEAVAKTSSAVEGAWDDRRWTLLALEQARDVIRELIAEPCVSHLFLTENEEQGQVDEGGNGFCGGMGGASPGDSRDGGGRASGVGVVLEVLASIESALCRRNGRAGCAQKGGGSTGDDADVRLPTVPRARTT